MKTLKLPVHSRITGWQITVFTVIALMIVLTMLLETVGFQQSWNFWCFAVLDPPLYDLVSIPGAVESVKDGLDPLVSNPHDPILRPLNYPRVWYRLFDVAGLTPDKTLIVGIVFALLYLTGIILVSLRESPAAGMIVSLLLLSPASIMAIHQGNNDLVIFFLVASAAAIMPRSSLLTCFIIIFAAVLKIFPAFALTSLGCRPQKRFAVFGTISAAVIVAYLVWIYPDLVLIRSNTPTAGAGSFGTMVIWARLKGLGLPSTLASAGIIGGYVLSLLLILATFILRRSDRIPPLQMNEKQAPFFWSGASIYTGVFLLGANYDYRLIFLILTAPTLMSLIMSSPVSAHRVISKIALAAIFLSTCYPWYRFLFEMIHRETRYVTYFLEELANWTVFLSLIFLQVSALPDWLLLKPISKSS